MAQIDKIKRAIAEISNKRKNVTLSDIEWVINQLKTYHVVKSRSNEHAVLFNIDGHRFSVCTHNPGQKQVKPAYVDEFLSVMAELEWYEE